MIRVSNTDKIYHFRCFFSYFSLGSKICSYMFFAIGKKRKKVGLKRWQMVDLYQIKVDLFIISFSFRAMVHCFACCIQYITFNLIEKIGNFMHQLIEFLCEPILFKLSQLKSVLCHMFRAGCFASLPVVSSNAYSWHNNWNEATTAKDLF